MTNENNDPDFLRWQEHMERHQKPDADQQQKTQEEIDYLINCYKRVFSGEEGRAVLADMERQFKYKESCFMASQRMTDFFLGQQSTVILINRIINQKDN